MATCFNRNSGVKNLIELYGEDGYKVMEEWGLQGVSPEIYDKKSKKLIASPLYQDIYNRLPSSLDSTTRAEEAFYIFTMAYSEEFAKKHGDWISNPTKYDLARYPSSGEPKLYSLEKDGYFKKFMKENSKRKSSLDKAISFLSNTIIELENKKEILERKAYKTEDKDESKRITNLIKNIQKSIDTNQIEQGVQEYLKYLNDDILPAFTSKIYDLEEDSDIGSSYVNYINDFIHLHKGNLLKLKRSLKNSTEYYNFYKSEVEPILTEVEGEMSDLESFIEDYMEEKVVNIAQEMYEDVDKEEVESWFKGSIKDINTMNRNFGIPSNSKDPIIRLVIELIRKIRFNIAKIVNPAIDSLIEKQVAMNNSGIKDMSVLNERVNGKKSGYLISEYRWGEYYIEQENMYKRVVEKTGLESWDAVLRYINQEDLNKKTDKLFLIFKKEIEKFNEKFRDKLGNPTPRKNEEFEKLMQNKSFADYYNTLYNIHTKAKESQPYSLRTRQHWWLLPQIRNNYLESIKTGGIQKGFKTFKRKTKEIVKPIDEDIEFGDIKRDRNGKIIKLVPLHYNSKLENQEDLSDDITAMYHQYYTMSENFKQVSNSVDDIEIIHRAMGKREIETPKSVDLVKDIIESQLYGQQLKDINIKLGNKEWNISKLLDVMFVKYPSTVNMFMNIPVAVSGFLKSRIDTQVENVVGNFTTFNSAKLATAEFTKQVPGVLAELGNKVKTNKLNLLLKYNQIDDIIHKQYRNLNIDTKGGRLATSDLAYVAMMPTGYAALSTLALSIYYNYRLIDGEFITESQFKSKYKESDKKWSNYKDKSLYNAYHVKDGKFQLKEEYKKYVNEDFEYKLSSKINTLSNRLEGKLSSLEKGAIYRNPLGRAVMLHRGWIPQLAGQRFKAKGKDFQMDEWNEGFYRTVGRLAINMFELTDGSIKLKLAKWNELEDFEKRNVLRFITDLTALIAIYTLAKVMNNIADDDDEDKWFLEYMAYQTNRLLLEQRAFWHPAEFFNILKSPAAAINQWEKITNMGSMLFHGGDTIQSGAYKDKTKFMRFLIQQSYLKNLYEIQHPKSKNTYLKSQIL